MKCKLFLISFFSTYSIQAATLSVLNNSNYGQGSLRQAIIDANANSDSSNVIEISSNLDAINISVLPLTLINKSLIMNVIGDGTQVINGNNNVRPFFIKSGTVELNNIHIQNGSAQGGRGGDGENPGGGGAGMGGALFIYGSSEVTISNGIFSNCSSRGGNAGSNQGGYSGSGGGLGGNGAGSAWYPGCGGGGFWGNGGIGGQSDYAGGGGGGGFFRNGGSAQVAFDEANPGGGAGGGGTELDGSPNTLVNGGSGGSMCGGGGGGGRGKGLGGNPGSATCGSSGGAGTADAGGIGGDGGTDPITGMGGGGGGSGGAWPQFALDGGRGGFGGGGGGLGEGAYDDPHIAIRFAGHGGFGGGGGAAGYVGQGGTGGFGGGGGGGGTREGLLISAGGNGGFGGGGATGDTEQGTGGFGGGNAANNGAGGGGAFGGAIFIHRLSSLKLIDPQFSNNSILAGSGSGSGGDGLAFGQDIFLMSGGSLTIDNSFDLTIDSAIESDQGAGGGVGGGFVKAGNAKLTFARSNTYTGSTKLSGGVLSISADNNLGVISNPLIFDGGVLQSIAPFTSSRPVTLNKAGTIEVASGSLIMSGIFDGQGPFTKTGSGTLELTGENTFSGDLSLNEGVLSVAADHNLGTGSLKLNGGTLFPSSSFTIGKDIDVIASSQIQVPNQTGLTLSGNLTGIGDLTKLGPGSIALVGNCSEFKGKTIVQEGICHCDGFLGGSLTIAHPSFFIATGSIGAVENNGTLIAGNSIGTLSVRGDYTQGNSASLVVEIDDETSGLSDQLDIQEIAHLKGSLILNPQPGIYEEGTVYTLLKANKVNGKFDHFLETHPLNFKLNYLPNAVQIFISCMDFILPVSIDQLKGNAKEVANYLFPTPCSYSKELTSLLRTLVKVSPSSFSKALLQLGPQQFGGLALSRLEASTRIGQSMNRASIAYENSWLSSSCQSFQNKHSVWLNPISYYHIQNEREEKDPFHGATYGFTTGVSTTVFDQIILSAGGGYTHSKLNWFENRGDACIQSAYFSPSIGYVGQYGSSGLVLLGSRSFYEANRKIHFSDFRAKAYSKHKSYDFLVGYQGNLRLKVAEKFQKKLFLLPMINLNYLNIFENSYQERGANPIDLSIKSKHSAFFRSELKIKLLKEFNTESTCSLPSICIGWLKNVPLTTGSCTSNFSKQEVPRKNFTVKSYHTSADELVLGAELLVMHKAGCSLKIGYEANIGSGSTLQEGNLNFNWTF